MKLGFDPRFDVKCFDSNICAPGFRGAKPANRMLLFARRPLAVAVCCLFGHAQVVRAADEVAAMPLPRSTQEVTALRLAVAEQPIKLRTAKKLISVVPRSLKANADDPMPMFIIADSLEGRSEDVTEADGNVELRKLDTRLLSDHLKYFPLEDEIEAEGHVRLTQSDGVNLSDMSGPYLRLKMTDQIGHFDEVDYHIRRDVKNRFYRPAQVAPGWAVNAAAATMTNAPMMLNVPSSYGLVEALPPLRPSDAYGKAQRLDFEGDKQMRLSEAEYSSCKPSEKDWYVKAKELYLDYNQEVATGKDALVYFKDLPIAYAPFGSFSLNHKPHSGFLSGSFQASTKNGLDLTLPYYWALAPNYDLTLHPRVMSKRGFQLGGEARYQDFNFNGTSRLEYMPKDDISKRSRYAYNVVHNQNLGQGLAMSLNWNGVSDDLYWSDLSSRLLQTSQVQLPKMAVFGYSPPASWWSASAMFLRYQTLQPNPLSPVARPYFIEPQINFVGGKPDLGGFDVGVLGQYTRFIDPTRDEGSRLVFYPQISMPYYSQAFSFVPKLGLHVTQYDLTRRTGTGASNISRVVPMFSMDSTVSFEREVSWQGRDFIQTLEPRLYYLNVPYRDQSTIPIFDSGVSDFNFAQIFGENRYTGYDRINDANHLTAAVTSRLIDSGSGAELFKAMVGERYYFNRQRVFVPGERLLPRNFSNFLAAFSGLVAPKTYVDSAWEYDSHRSRVERFSIGARYQPDKAKVISASYRYGRDALGVTQLEQVDLAGQWPLTKGWYAVGRYNYSLRDKQLLEAVGGLEYNAGCWAARFVFQRLEAVGGTPNTTFFFQLELNDFASVGSSPVQLLRRSVPGYGKVNELPTTGSLLTSE